MQNCFSTGETCYLAARELEFLKDRTPATNYSVQVVKQTWFDTRLEGNIIALWQNNTPQEEATNAKQELNR